MGMKQQASYNTDFRMQELHDPGADTAKDDTFHMDKHIDKNTNKVNNKYQQDKKHSYDNYAHNNKQCRKAYSPSPGQH